jgi:hypothetical protein
VKLNECRDEDEHEKGVVDAFVRFHADLTRIDLHIGSERVASFTVSADTAGPTPTTAMRPGLRYNVQVSTDGGSHWETVAVGLENVDAYRINRADFVGARRLRQRILATDGLRSFRFREEDIPLD